MCPVEIGEQEFKIGASNTFCLELQWRRKMLKNSCDIFTPEIT